jgi:hypothetical protein
MKNDPHALRISLFGEGRKGDKCTACEANKGEGAARIPIIGNPHALTDV